MADVGNAKQVLGTSERAQGAVECFYRTGDVPTLSPKAGDKGGVPAPHREESGGEPVAVLVLRMLAS